MVVGEHRDCFGTMYPDNLHLRVGRTNRGKVFSVQLQRIAALMPAERKITVDTEQWDQCTACPEFNSCYKLCVAKVALESVVATA
ncbi:hypothetical protein [Crateriforma conspicua]|uniref:Uncharacterized protein n=1 Tax=Crateriforma conspicua TaxID=2527996 RepID=A0A5C5Y1N4_9PLAN|nr:hypothetical protein [Crateriforma conspicua]TWT68739.1 hypothetical protein Pan14r_09860 [Crateriforma conspicua]